jgi:hypothetical protein
MHPAPDPAPRAPGRAPFPDADAGVDELMALAEWLRDRRNGPDADRAAPEAAA